ncbi:MAG: family 43 glycosylhydrolase [Lewinella sp.]|nr:family 43 glycosylhydrolase [Lewinella sp.]
MLICFLVWSTKGSGQEASEVIPDSTAIPTSDIRIRDPYILTDPETQTYFMYAQIGNRLTGDDDPRGVEVYISKDLKNWAAPQAVLTLDNDFPARKRVWAPEVHKYRGKYYLLVTLTSEEKISDTPNPLNGETQWRRGTHIFRANSPLGPFEPFGSAAHTPAEWMSLDGTLFVEKEKPYMVFCHEWAQTLDGEMNILRLKHDLSAPAGVPQLLFRATDAPWVRNMQDVGIKRNGYVTDGPAFYRNAKGELIMIWSSFGDEQYAIGQAISRSGSVFGPWKQIAAPLVKANGGHGMFFRDLSGVLQLAFHQPNGGGKERLHLIPLRETDNGLLALDRTLWEKE